MIIFEPECLLLFIDKSKRDIIRRDATLQTQPKLKYNGLRKLLIVKNTVLNLKNYHNCLKRPKK